MSSQPLIVIDFPKKLRYSFVRQIIRQFCFVCNPVEHRLHCHRGMVIDLSILILPSRQAILMPPTAFRTCHCLPSFPASQYKGPLKKYHKCKSRGLFKTSSEQADSCRGITVNTKMDLINLAIRLTKWKQYQCGIFLKKHRGTIKAYELRHRYCLDVDT